MFRELLALRAFLGGYVAVLDSVDDALILIFDAQVLCVYLKPFVPGW